MKPPLTLLLLCCLNIGYAQLVNKSWNDEHNALLSGGCKENEIVATDNSISIVVRVIYNAVPDGYHITYTRSFIGKTVEEVEYQMNKKADSLIHKIHQLHVTDKEVVVDITSLDPVFDFNRNDSLLSKPTGYKISENLTFNIQGIDKVRTLSKTCLDYGFYDMIGARAYVENSKVIYDSLASKAVILLDMKKQMSTKIGWSFTGGKVNFTKFKDIIYPSERYLHSYISNQSLYKHHSSQNSTLMMERKVEVDNYSNMNLKDADYVFNASLTSPAIQFYYQLNYNYTKKDTEAEMKEKLMKEMDKKADQQFYIIDKKGNLKKIEMN
jgi:hypothetical protein